MFSETPSELGRLLAAAEGYDVLARDGSAVGTVAYVRYETYADRPDELVVCRGKMLRRRRRRVPVDAVARVNAREATVTLAIDRKAVDLCPSL